MNKGTWVHWLLASIVILLVGAVLVAAEDRIEVKVEKESANEITVDINGEVETIHLDDLADGEERSFDVGDHNLVVKRVGDDLRLTSDGHAFGVLGGHGVDLDTMLWVTDDGEKIEIDGEGDHSAVKKVVVMKTDAEGGGETRSYTVHIDGEDVLLGNELDIEIDELMDLDAEGHPHAVFISKDGAGDHPVIIKSQLAGIGMVTYRCEETGSVLRVKKEDAIEDAYICPATGCVMTKVEEPEFRVIKIRKQVETEGADQ